MTYSCDDLLLKQKDCHNGYFVYLLYNHLKNNML